MKLSQFNRLTNRTKRVKIAQDILARIAAKKFISRRGQYSDVCSISDKVLEENKYNSAQELIEDKSCAVCAKGALVMSWVALFNNKSIQEVIGQEEIAEINDIFPKTMRDAMEAAYEGYAVMLPGARYWETPLMPPKHYGEKKWSLTKIMQNIVDNKGRFKVGNYFFGSE